MEKRAETEVGELRLLGICFWREGLEAAFGPERRGEKGGCQKTEEEQRFYEVTRFSAWRCCVRLFWPNPCPRSWNAVLVR